MEEFSSGSFFLFTDSLNVYTTAALGKSTYSDDMHGAEKLHGEVSLGKRSTR